MYRQALTTTPTSCRWWTKPGTLTVKQLLTRSTRKVGQEKTKRVHRASRIQMAMEVLARMPQEKQLCPAAWPVPITISLAQTSFTMVRSHRENLLQPTSHLEKTLSMRIVQAKRVRTFSWITKKKNTRKCRRSPRSPSHSHNRVESQRSQGRTSLRLTNSKKEFRRVDQKAW